ncbi:LysR substrate-binding domain-containing protein [Sphingomonas sp.]|uniref:LysR substrate-binding domain-containing protein n=1 Tax=Sphingomonas sp. TaxID=28214 RepID=UPI00286E08D8|nr:LysR substrate-binding domain-containing protein [Sphingomonas sp.]
MRRLPPLPAVRAFEAAARLESFTGAAAELGLTQAAVSYQVKALEERLGAPLFVREKGRARLTPLGQRLLTPLTQAFDGIEAAFASHRAEDEALLTVTTTQTFANTWLAWRVGSFQMAHPDLAVRLTTGHELTDLRGGDADVAIRAGSGNWEGLECQLLMPIDFTPMASPAFLARVERELGRRVEPADLPGLPMITPDDDWWDSWLSEAGVAAEGRLRRGGLRLDSQASEGHAAMGGEGFVLLTPAFWRGDLAEGRLVQPFAQVTTRGFAYWLVYPPERRLVPKIKRFREWLTEEMARALAAPGAGAEAAPAGAPDAATPPPRATPDAVVR